MDFSSNTALITGSSGGIGEEFAVQLAQRGVNLVLVARRADKLEAVARHTARAAPGPRGRRHHRRPRDPGLRCRTRRRRSATSVGAIDILVNNAGVGLHGKFVGQEPDANAAQIQLNCGTLVDLTARFLPPMTAAGHGVVINVASTAGFQPTPGMAVYGATKAFVLSFTEALWQECKGTGVRVLALCPGATETEFFARTGEEFLTDGRQTSKQVVDTAMAALDKSTPTVVSGWRNALLPTGYRFTPRRLMVQMSEQLLKAN